MLDQKLKLSLHPLEQWAKHSNRFSMFVEHPHNDFSLGIHFQLFSSKCNALIRHTCSTKLRNNKQRNAKFVEQLWNISSRCRQGTGYIFHIRCQITKWNNTLVCSLKPVHSSSRLQIVRAPFISRKTTEWIIGTSLAQPLAVRPSKRRRVIHRTLAHDVELIVSSKSQASRMEQV